MKSGVAFYVSLAGPPMTTEFSRGFNELARIAIVGQVLVQGRGVAAAPVEQRARLPIEAKHVSQHSME